MNDKVSPLFGNLISLWALCIVLYGAFVVGCDSNKSADRVASHESACKGLVYGESGRTLLTFGEFRPCAAEMISKLEEMTPYLKATLEGDRQAREKGIKVHRELTALINNAGGFHKLLGRWLSDDEDLEILIKEIIDAYNHYEAFLRVTMLGTGSPAAKPEFERGKEALERAKWIY